MILILIILFIFNNALCMENDCMKWDEEYLDLFPSAEEIADAALPVINNLSRSLTDSVIDAHNFNDKNKAVVEKLAISKMASELTKDLEKKQFDCKKAIDNLLGLGVQSGKRSSNNNIVSKSTRGKIAKKNDGTFGRGAACMVCNERFKTIEDFHTHLESNKNKHAYLYNSMVKKSGRLIANN